MRMGGLMWPMLTLVLLPSLHIVGSSSLPYAYGKSVQVSEEIVTDSILDCHYEGKKDDGDGDGDGDSSSSDIIVVCQFRFVRPAASRLDEEEDGEDHGNGDDDDDHVHIRTVIPLEPTRVTDERGLPTNYLVSGVMHYQQQLQQQQQSEHNHNKAASTTATITATTTSPEQFEEKEEWSDPDSSSSSSSSSSSLSSPKERVLEVGLATYRPPYSQHGSRVQAVLNRAPKKDLVLLFDKSSVMDEIDHEDHHDHHDNDDYDSWLVLMKEWVDWYLELGSAHFPTANQQNHIREDDNVWVEQVELAINAYRQAIHVLEQQVNTDQRRLHLLVRVLDQDIVLATAYYYLGEAYYLDPDLRYIHQSVEAYQKSQRIYQSILLLSLNEQQQQQQQEEDGDGEGRNTQEEWTHQQQQRQRKQQVEARLAECSTKLGMALLYSMDPMATAMISAMVMGNNNNNNGATPSHALSILHQAQEHFQTAIGIYESSLLLAAAEEEEVEEEDTDEKRKRSPHREEEEEEDRQEWELGYATALQQAASAFAMEGKLQEARRYYEQALAIQSDSILPKAAAAAAATNSIQAQQNSQTAIADLYLSLSDTCVQLGDYPCAKESYQNAMDFHAQYNIPVAPVTTSMVMEPGDDEFMGEDGGDGGGTYRSDVEMAISETLEALKEYRLGTSGAGGSGGQNRRPYSNDGLDGPDHGDAAYYYEKDDGYEGDLLASLGTMYLSLGDETNLVRAIGYLELAVEKYSNSPEDRKSVAMADLLVNLALAYYRNYQFEDSIFTQWKALDIFQSLYGDGVNPYTQDENYNEMLNMMQEQHHQSTMGGAGGYPGGGKQFTSQKQQQQQQPPIKPKGEKPKDETKKVDLESYRRSIQNVTEGATPKTVKEEL